MTKTFMGQWQYDVKQAIGIEKVDEYATAPEDADIFYISKTYNSDVMLILRALHVREDNGVEVEVEDAYFYQIGTNPPFNFVEFGMSKFLRFMCLDDVGPTQRISTYIIDTQYLPMLNSFDNIGDVINGIDSGKIKKVWNCLPL